MSTSEYPTVAKPPRAGASEAAGHHPLSERVLSLRLPQEPTWDRARGSWVAWLLCLVFAGSTAALAYLYFTRPPQENTPTAEGVAAAAAEKAASGATAAVGAIALESKGYVVPVHQIMVSPQVGGKILRLFIEEGKLVNEGDVLAELEDKDYLADYERAQGMLDAAKQRLAELQRNWPEEIKQVAAELKEASAQLPQLKRDLDRNELLRDKRIVAEEVYDLAQSKYLAMNYRVEKLQTALDLVQKGPRVEKIRAAQGDVRQAEGELAKAKWRLDKCVIRAPESGTILRKNAEKGNIVNPMAFNGSYSICDMANLADLEVDLSIQERDISRIFQGQKCKVRAEAYPDRVYEGSVSRVMPIADRAKGAVPVRVKLLVPPGEEGVYLKPEMGAIVSFLGKPVADAQRK